MAPPEATSLSGQASATYSYLRDPVESLLLLSIPGGSRVSVEEIAASIVLNALANGQVNLALGADLKRGKVLITTGEADGFIARILSGFEVESNFDLGASFSMAEGLHFHGSSTLEIQLASHISLGPVEIQALTLLIGIEGNAFPVGVAVDLKAVLGPLVAIVQGIGIEVAIALADDNKGNVGPVDFRLRFLPPKGVGLSLDVGVVKGGGYLFIDPDRGEYAGALELSLFGVVTIKAIGIITTKMPDGSKGFSLLIIMSVEFGTGIQLGFGFTLLAVGGLLGLNRTMKLEALRTASAAARSNRSCSPRTSSPTRRRSSATCATSSRRKKGTFLIGPMVEARMGHADAGQRLARHHHRDPRQHRDRRHPARSRSPPTTSRSSCCRSTSSARSSSTRSASGSSPRCSSRAIVFLTIEGEMGLLRRVRRRRELRRQRRRLPSALQPAAAAVPEPAPHRGQPAQHPDRAHRASRATSRSPPTRCSSARASRCSSASTS